MVDNQSSNLNFDRGSIIYNLFYIIIEIMVNKSKIYFKIKFDILVIKTLK